MFSGLILARWKLEKETIIMAEKAKKMEEKRSVKLSSKEKILLLFAVAISTALFFYLASSEINNWIKAPLIIAELAGSGMLIAKIGRFDNYYGIIVLKGKGGFGTMRYFAKNHPRAARELADFGLSLSFGIPYSYYLFRKDANFWKFPVHTVLVTLFFIAINGLTVQDYEGTEGIFLAINLALGLVGLGGAFLFTHGLKILTVEGTPAGVMPVVPGVTIPWEGIIAIIIAATVHEVSHGILAMVEKLKVKSSGVILFGIVPIGAFVDPDEEEFKKIAIHKRRRILVAGSTANFFAFLIFGLLTAGVAIYASSLIGGTEVFSVMNTSSAYGVLHEKETIMAINGIAIGRTADVAKAMQGKKEGEIVKIRTQSGESDVTLSKGGKLGVLLQEFPKPGSETAYGISIFILVVFGLTVIINFALATVNMLPLFLTDGYRVVYEELTDMFPSGKNEFAKKASIAIGLVIVALLLLNLFPNFR